MADIDETNQQQQIDMAAYFKRNIQNQQMRKIVFEEHELPEAQQDNYYQSGIYKIKFNTELNETHDQLIETPDSYSFDPLLLNEIITTPDPSRPPRPIALANLGNSCYMNSVLQVIYNCRYFARLLGNAQFSALQKNNQVCDALLKTFKQYCSAKRPNPIEPRDFANILPILGFSVMQQSDAGELFYKLIDYICVYEAKQTGFADRPHLERETTALDQLMHQVHVQQVICKSCGACKTQSIGARSCLIPIDKTMRRGFQQYYKPCEISGYKCDSCQQEVEIKKTQRVIRVGDLFIVQLQRWDDFGRKSQKSCRVNLYLNLYDGVNIDQIPDESSKYSIYSNTNRTGATHELVGLINHVGIEAFGHYFSYVKYFNTWYVCDDEIVREVDESKITDGKEWILAVYQKMHIERRVQRLKSKYEEGQDLVIGSNIENKLKTTSNDGDTNKQLRASNKDVFKGIEESTDDEQLDDNIKAQMQPGGMLSRKSDILHHGQQEDMPRRRKTQAMRDENRRQRMEEIAKRRQRKSKAWHDEQLRRKRENAARK